MSSPVPEANVPAGFPWLRWGLVVLLILVGVGLVLVLGPDSQPVVQPDVSVR
jgi:hypothetical protein